MTLKNKMDSSKIKRKFFDSLNKLSSTPLTKLSDYDIELRTSDFLKNVFYFSKLQLDLTDEEKIHIHKKLLKILPNLDVGLDRVFWPLFQEVRTEAKIYRSAVEFIGNYLGIFVADERMVEPLTSIMNSNQVAWLDNMIHQWNDDGCIRERPSKISNVDLTGIPDTHYWWTENDRSGLSIV